MKSLIILLLAFTLPVFGSEPEFTVSCKVMNGLGHGPIPRTQGPYKVACELNSDGCNGIEEFIMDGEKMMIFLSQSQVSLRVGEGGRDIKAGLFFYSGKLPQSFELVSGDYRLICERND